MSVDPLHPALVHIPLGLALAVPLVFGGLAVAIWRGLLPRRTWLVAVGLQALLVAAGGAAFLSGEREEHRVERVVAERLIDEHQDRAQAFLWAAGAVLALSLVGVVVRERRTPSVAAFAVAGSLLVAGMGIWTGKAGGELVYRHGAARAYTGGLEAPVEAARPVERRGETHRD